MIALIILAAVFGTGMIIMIFDSFNLYRIFKKSPIKVIAGDFRETKMFFVSKRK